jgi:putative transposase
MVRALGVSERRACRVIGQHRSTQRKDLIRRDDEDALTHAIICLAEQFGQYGYRRIAALLRDEGWHVNQGQGDRGRRPRKRRRRSTASGAGRGLKCR